MEWNLLDVVLRVSFVLFSTFLISIITILAIRLAKIDIKDFSQRIGVKFMLIALAGNLALILVVFLSCTLLNRKVFFLLAFIFLGFNHYSVSSLRFYSRCYLFWYSGTRGRRISMYLYHRLMEAKRSIILFYSPFLSFSLLLYKKKLCFADILPLYFTNIVW